MCQYVVIDGRVYDTVGQLQSVPGMKVWYDVNFQGIVASQCLCCVDLEKTAELSGFDWEVDFPWGYKFTRKPSQPQEDER